MPADMEFLLNQAQNLANQARDNDVKQNKTNEKVSGKDLREQWEVSRECKLLDFCFLEVEDLFGKVGYKNWNRRTYDMFFHAGIDKDSSLGP